MMRFAWALMVSCDNVYFVTIFTISIIHLWYYVSAVVVTKYSVFTIHICVNVEGGKKNAVNYFVILFLN